MIVKYMERNNEKQFPARLFLTGINKISGTKNLGFRLKYLKNILNSRAVICIFYCKIPRTGTSILCKNIMGLLS